MSRARRNLPNSCRFQPCYLSAKVCYDMCRTFCLSHLKSGWARRRSTTSCTICALVCHTSCLIDIHWIAVVFHHGSRTLGGHYTACVRWRDGWVHCDDDHLRPIALDDVLSKNAGRQAYLLAYIRR